MRPSTGFLLATLCATSACGSHPDGAHSTLGGSYTAEQAAHGKDLYAGMCVSCHAGMGNHVGPVFRKAWGGQSLGAMFEFVSTNMPKNDPGSLGPDEYVAIMAYLLQLNGMPPGSRPLPIDTVALRAIIYDTVATPR